MEGVGFLHVGELEPEVPVHGGLVGGIGGAQDADQVTDRRDQGVDLGRGHPGGAAGLA